MKAIVKKLDLRQEFYIEERCFITELSNSPDDSEVSIARARIEPGVTSRWHRLNAISERYYILEGKGIVETGDHPPTEVGPGDIVLIPPMCRQRIENVGSEDLIFLAICSPPFSIDAYEDIE